MPPTGFENAILAIKRQQNYTLDRTATGIGTDTRVVIMQNVLMLQQVTYSYH